MFQKLEDSRMNKLKGLFNLELKKTIRTPIIMFFSILAPQFFIYIQSSLSEEVIMNGQSIPSIDYSFPMFLYLAVIVVGIGNVGVGMSYNRLIKFFTRLKVSNVRAIDFIVANFFVQLSIAVLSTLLLFLSSILVLDMSLEGRNWTIFFLVFFLVWIMTYLIGIVLANIVKDAKTSQSVSLIVYFFLIFFSGVTYPIELMPELLQKISKLLPTYYGLRVLQEAWYINGNIDTTHLIIVIGSTVILFVISLKIFKFD